LLSEFAAQEDPEQQAAPAAAHEAHEDGEQQAAPQPLTKTENNKLQPLMKTENNKLPPQPLTKTENNKLPLIRVSLNP